MQGPAQGHPGKGVEPEAGQEGPGLAEGGEAQQLGLAAAGATGLLSGCSDDDTDYPADGGTRDGAVDRGYGFGDGIAPMPDAAKDRFVPRDSAGVKPGPDAPMDLARPPDRAPQVVDGLPARPDAALDLYQGPPDMPKIVDGLAPMPDAALDAKKR